ncbi:GST [Lepeophtheirus salmonis]|uniref:GST n=1 Tax=Lepeophtheirus salmonis TaxID=72036 RepID=A0A7R8H0R9_LEPSM|nr:GST [Lepeophtheirus salmonis]CAF2774458.1 GST [Lepeophtheirus salmonis]
MFSRTINNTRMSVKIYGMDLLPNHRIVTMAAEVVGAPYEVKYVDIAAGVHKTPEFLEVSIAFRIDPLAFTYIIETRFAARTKDMTIADIAWVATYSSIKEADLVDLLPYKELDAWFTKCVALIPNYETCNGKGVKVMGDFYRSKTKA